MPCDLDIFANGFFGFIDLGCIFGTPCPAGRFSTWSGFCCGRGRGGLITIEKELALSCQVRTIYCEANLKGTMEQYCIKFGTTLEKTVRGRVNVEG